MEQRPIIYLDNAATTFPKPQAVYEEVLRCMTQYGGNPGRGAHALSLAASEKIYQCRILAAELFDAEPERVFFTMNTTYALNMVLKGLLHRGDHVLISDLEHNAVYRPLYRMQREGIVRFDTFRTLNDVPEIGAAAIEEELGRKLRPKTRMIVCIHSSNICSAMLPISEIGRFCRRFGLLFVVDAAQSAGHEPISVDRMGIDALCVPGHKGLYGPQGCGMVILGKGILPNTLIEGGNGVHSLEGSMPNFSPERYEAGTLPTPAIAGLYEGMRAVRKIGVAEIGAHEKKLYRRAKELLGQVRGVKLYVPQYEGSVLLWNLQGKNAEETGRLLNESGICVRSGYHCSALGHRTLQTPQGGAVRVSFGMYNSYADVEVLGERIRQLSAEAAL